MEEVALWIFIIVDFFLFARLIYSAREARLIEESIIFERKVRMIKEKREKIEKAEDRRLSELATLSASQLN